MRQSATSPALHSLGREDSLEAAAITASDSPDPPQPLDALQEADAGRATVPRGKTAPVQAVTSAVYGYRSAYKALAGVGAGLSAGVKSSRGLTLGFLRYQGDTPIRSLQIGNLKMRLGERMVLGRPFGSSVPSVSGAVRGGMAVAPSLSPWFGRFGAAVEADVAGFRGQLVVVADEHRRPAGDGAVWFSLRRYGRPGGLGIAVARRRGARPAAARAPSLIDVFGSVHSRGVVASAEVAVYPERTPFCALRVAQARPSRWSLSLYRAPSFRSADEPLRALPPGKTVLEGGMLNLTRGVGAARIEALLALGRSMSNERRRSYRRMTAVVSGRWNDGLRWTAMIDRLAETVVSHGAGTLAERGKRAQRRKTRLRLRLQHEPLGRFAHDVRVDYLPSAAGMPAGTLVSLATRATLGPFEAEWRVSAYSLPPGRQGSISRPGLGSFELFSPVYGAGSDLALRLRWRVSKRLRISAYYGEPRSGLRRVYLSGEVRASR